MIARESSSDVSGPKFIVPRHNSLTCSAVRPSRRYFIRPASRAVAYGATVPGGQRRTEQFVVGGAVVGCGAVVVCGTGAGVGGGVVGVTTGFVVGVPPPPPPPAATVVGVGCCAFTVVGVGLPTGRGGGVSVPLTLAPASLWKAVDRHLPGSVGALPITPATVDANTARP